MATLNCPLACPIPDGYTLTEVPVPRHAWSDTFVCPNVDEGCGKAWLVLDTPPRQISGETVLALPCPDCSGRITYNGNYYCLDCDWALPQIETDELAEFAVKLYVSLMAIRGMQPDQTYLDPEAWKQ